MSPTADCLTLDNLFEVSGRSAVLCGQRDCLEDGNQAERRRPKKSSECMNEKCRRNTNTTSSHMTWSLPGPQRLETK